MENISDLEKGIYILLDRYEILSKLGYVLSFFIVLLIIVVIIQYYYNKMMTNKVLDEYNKNTQEYILMVNKLNKHNEEKNNYINTNKYKCIKYKNGIVCKRKKNL